MVTGKNRVACVTKSLWPCFMFALHAPSKCSLHTVHVHPSFSSVPFPFSHPLSKFGASVCVCVWVLVFLFQCCCFFAANVPLRWFMCVVHSSNVSLRNDTETFSMFHSVNVLINIMTHSICMMSQLAHFNPTQRVAKLLSLSCCCRMRYVYSQIFPVAFSHSFHFCLDFEVIVRSVARSIGYFVHASFRFENSIWNI